MSNLSAKWLAAPGTALSVPMPPCYDRSATDFCEPGRFSHNSKTVPSTVHVSPFEKARTNHLGRPRPPSQSSKMILASVRGGGAGGTRTPCLFNAIEALSQMSYSPSRAAGPTAGAAPQF